MTEVINTLLTAAAKHLTSTFTRPFIYIYIWKGNEYTQPQTVLITPRAIDSHLKATDPRQVLVCVERLLLELHLKKMTIFQNKTLFTHHPKPNMILMHHSFK